ncbi:MAG: hypothetical protein IKH81_03680 [Clostridia bacterium]|nr:hypothetical protein [Clostridia bacterium]
MNITDYLSLFPGHTREKPRFMALAEAILHQVEDLWQLLPEMECAFSFSYASGLQLDALGASVSVPRREGWDDETYRSVLLRKLKLWTWDGTNETVPSFLSEGETLQDNDNMTVTVHADEPLPVPSDEWFPVPAGVKAVEGS